jgi:hypothetical protein
LPSNISTHNFTASTSECRFTCNTWYTYDLGSNTCVWNSCTIPATDTYNSKTYTIATPGTLLHNNSVTKSGTYAFGTSPNNGTISADFVYSCNAWVLSKSVSNTGGSCNTGYTFNNNYSSPACTANCPAGWILSSWKCYSSLKWPLGFQAWINDCNSFWWVMSGVGVYCWFHPSDICPNNSLLKWNYVDNSRYGIRYIDNSWGFWTYDISQYYTSWIAAFFQDDLNAWWWWRDGTHYYRCEK